ncbi:hypothetical protein MVEG_03928 [Podila verticillata NRRL 6337]|nr:hypothetical protein MVEG_03928 [Podila verticillata NRRL 6337]
MYYYHLKLDLYSRPPTQQGQQHNSSQGTSKTDNTAISTLQEPASNSTSPSRVQALFKPFPQYRPPRLQGLSKSLSKRSRTSFSFAESQSNRPPHSKTGSDHSEHHVPHLPLDYRFGNIHIATLDNPQSTAQATSGAPTVSVKDKSAKTKPRGKKMASAASEATTTTQTPTFKEDEPAQGILRLYKDTNEITTGDVVEVRQDGHETTTSSGELETLSSHERESQIIHPDHGTAVCVLAVPTYMSPGDFLNFVGPVRQNVSHFRIIRDSVPNRFMVLMKFRTSEATAEFYRRYNGKAFSSLEPEICHVVYLKSIEIRAGCMPPYAFPFFNDDPFLQSHSPTSTHPTHESESTNSSKSRLASISDPHTSHDTTSQDHTDVDLDLAALQMAALSTAETPGLEELPTCPVCLERMDSSVTGLLTILCQHTFHCHCLSKWGEGSCPVCRYSQKTIKGTPGHRTLRGGGIDPETTTLENEDENMCAVCGTTENLWICLICGHIGCGRYQEKHAYSHYYDTSHLYALELETQRVWDYAGDGYVHRLIQNKTDGKLVELPSAVDGQLPSQHSVQVGQEKLDAIGLEYTYLLTSQLESQRLYFDAQMAAMTAQLAQVNKEAKEWEKEAMALNEKNQALAQMAEQLEKEKPTLLKEKKAAEKRLDKMQEKLAMLERQYEEEKEMNVGLRTNQDSFKEKLQAKEAEIEELQEQVRDMMIYLDTQQKVEASPLKDELVNGTIGVVMAPGGSHTGSSSSSSPSGHRRKGRK